MYSTSSIIIAFTLTLIAGLSTGIGGILATQVKCTNKKFLSGSLAFSAGVMVYVSFMEMLPDGFETLNKEYGHKGELFAILAFIVGILIIGIIDRLIPEETNFHEIGILDDCQVSDANKSLVRVGLFSALAVTIHNLPEGMATFMASLSDPALGISIALAIALHNIPEGIAVAVPIFHATNSKKKALKYAFISGLAEPLGALLTFLFLMPFLNDTIIGIVFCIVAGIMIYISIEELMPAAHKFGHHHITIYSFMAGMIIMAISLFLLH
ncbi:MAG: zinc transporter ZupT [Erysipelotrichales bacterium]